MSVWLSCRRVFVGALLLLLFLGGLSVPELAAQQESSPIAVELIVQEAAGPGSVLEVRIQYDAMDLKAGADLNYNVFGPAHILRRDPEPPNPVVNTWHPGAQGLPAKGTIVIEVQVDQDVLGQTIEHQVEVRWGTKVLAFGARTTVKAVAPTAVPTSRPRPRPTQTVSVPTPTPVPQVKPTIEMDRVTLLDSEGQTLVEAEAHQAVVLEVAYSSSAEIDGWGGNEWSVDSRSLKARRCSCARIAEPLFFARRTAGLVRSNPHQQMAAISADQEPLLPGDLTSKRYTHSAGGS